MGRAAGVAPDALLGPGGQGVDNGLGGFKVHVGNPQGDHLVRSKLLNPLVIFGRAVVLAVDDGVKIVLHYNIILSR